MGGGPAFCGGGGGGGGAGGGGAGGGESGGAGMTEAEVNKLAARVMRAKMMGRAEEAASLEAELQRAKAALAQAPPPPPKPVVSMSAAGGEVEVGVPNEMVGHIIGKEGASLAALRKESGARTTITREPQPQPQPQP